jgi:hypothetical protein
MLQKGLIKSLFSLFFVEKRSLRDEATLLEIGLEGFYGVIMMLCIIVFLGTWHMAHIHNCLNFVMPIGRYPSTQQ